MIPLRLLIVEDSLDDTELILHELRRGGYEPTAERVETEEGMTAALTRGPWDVVISDYFIPRFGALDALRLVKAGGLDLPFIIVSGSIGEEIAVAAMKAGAHDYLMKDHLARLTPAIARELKDAESRSRHRQSEERFRQLAESIQEVFWMTDPAKREVLYISPSYETIWGRPCRSLYDDPGSFLESIHPDDRDRVTDARALQAGGAYDEEYRIVKPDGAIRWIRDRAFPIKDASGAVYRIAGIAQDITDRKQHEETVRHLAYYDALTGLPNRTLLHDRLQQAVLLGRRSGNPVALLLMDLNRFKEVNDTLGHHKGDLLLQQVGMRLHDLIRESDTVGRLGGDEFAVLLQGTGAADHAMGVADKLLKTLEAPFVVDGLTLEVGASIGIALWPRHADDVNQLMQRADVAMYTAKQTGVGAIVYSADQDTHSHRRLELAGELRHAIERGELTLHYQPKLSVATRRVIGVEALVRWRHPTRGLLSPDQFIPLAEQTGTITALTMWVLDAALRQAGMWRAAGLVFPVAVNLSARTLHSPTLSKEINGLFAASGMSPDGLGLEITESTIMVDPARAMDVLRHLSHMGVWLSIDDFGTGYSSLSYLKKLPVVEIKIDKSFVVQMDRDADDAVIVRSTIDLAHNLGLTVVAEGVENRATWDRLADWGCDAAQGYYLSRPVPADDLTPRLTDTPWNLLPGGND
ncbi:MAG: EAL domain-containing protein [Nitrospiria bacterium]